jgi:signal transduction histidine kinase
VRWQQSLRLRLLLWGAGSIALALLIAGFFILGSFSASLEAARRDDLQASLDRLTAAIDPSSVDLTASDPLSDPRYDTPLSGLYWQIEDRDTGLRIRSRSLWDQQLPVRVEIGDSAGRLSEVTGPQGKLLIAFSRSLTIEGPQGNRHFNVAVAEALDQDSNPFSRFGINLTFALLVLGVVLTIAAAVQIQFGLRPLSILRQQIADVRHGASTRLQPATAGELEPVVTQINELIDAQEATIAFARERAADLAHGLKTPLAVLSASAERLRAGGDAANADLLQMLADQMNSRIEYQLHIARLRVRTSAQGTSSSLNETVLRSVAVLRKSVAGERLNWLVHLEEDLRVDIDEHDLMELAGIVLENASQWATASVRINGTRTAEAAILAVDDDGAGLSDEMIARLGVRGVRLDESSAGQGLGLSIAFEIVRLNRGTIAIDHSRFGGMRLTVTLPLA